MDIEGGGGKWRAATYNSTSKEGSRRLEAKVSHLLDLITIRIPFFISCPMNVLTPIQEQFVEPRPRVQSAQPHEVRARSLHRYIGTFSSPQGLRCSPYPASLHLVYVAAEIALLFAHFIVSENAVYAHAQCRSARCRTRTRMVRSKRHG